MKCLLPVILAILLVVTEGKVVPASDIENQQTGTQPLQLSDRIKEAQNVINNLTAQLQLNLTDQKEFFDTIKEQSSNLVNNVQAYLKNASDEVSANI